MRVEQVRFVIITGMSGAGKSLAVHCFEDLGYFCIDNIPPTLIPKLAELCAQSAGKIKQVALVVDIRGGEFFTSSLDSLGALEKVGFPYNILFLEASDDALVRRFKETRRRHPLAPHGRVLEGIHAERERLDELRGRANGIIDTSRLSPQELRAEITRRYGADEGTSRLMVSVVSFGFKHGVPLDSDLVFDVRFLPNPQYVKSLRELDGGHPAVRDYLFRWPISGSFMAALTSFLDFLLPNYVNEGKTQLTVGVGCTGGLHRSVAVAERLADFLRDGGYPVTIEHRDVHRRDPGAGKR